MAAPAANREKALITNIKFFLKFSDLPITRLKALIPTTGINPTKYIQNEWFCCTICIIIPTNSNAIANEYIILSILLVVIYFFR